MTGFKTHQMADLRHSIRFEKFSYQYTAFIGTKSPGIRIEALEAPRDTLDGKKRKSVDQFMAFQDPLEREFWYHIIVEVQAGWKQSQSTLTVTTVLLTVHGYRTGKSPEENQRAVLWLNIKGHSWF